MILTETEIFSLDGHKKKHQEKRVAGRYMRPTCCRLGVEFATTAVVGRRECVIRSVYVRDGL